VPRADVRPNPVIVGFKPIVVDPSAVLADKPDTATNALCPLSVENGDSEKPEIPNAILVF
jgi:hypothetical protein